MINKLLTSIIALCALGACCSEPQIALSETDFKTPPQWARPHTWMHAMSGNMSKEGMTKDLESMVDVGIGGIILFNVTQGIPYGDVDYNSEEHHDILKHTAAECERLGLSFGYHNCDGWTSSGGPWITPEQSMKMVVARQVVTKGGAVDIALPQPTTREGLYCDIATVAYPASESDIIDSKAKVKVTATDPSFDVEVAMNSRTEDMTMLKKVGDKEAAIFFDYGEPFPLSSIYLTCNDRLSEYDLYASDNGVDYQKVMALTQVRVGKGEWSFFDSFEPLNKRYYKIVTPITVTIRDIRMSAASGVDDYLSKTSIARREDVLIKDTKIVREGDVIKSSEIIDLTSSLKDGHLKATLPAGDWTILRVGYTSTGAKNVPSSIKGQGLECDKFSREAVTFHFNAFAKRVIDNAQSVAPNATQYIEIDSYELGGQNWTDDFVEIFENSKGYDLMSFIPLLVGKYVDDVETSESILRDFREVCCDLMNENYFGEFVNLCHANNMKCYIEPYGNGAFDCLEVGGKADITMGEFWMARTNTLLSHATSSSHIYGHNIVSAESFTSTAEINWKGHPAMAKPAGDIAWKDGLNQFMFHRFVHQANTHVKPGLTMNRWGFHFDRTQTWWYNAGVEWFDYMARGCYLLRLGVPVNDVMIFVGDASPSGAPTTVHWSLKADATNADVLINRAVAKNSEIVLPEGTTYKVLVLRNSDKLHMETIERIYYFAKAGVPIVGELPTGLLGYQHSKATNEKVLEISNAIRQMENYYTMEEADALLEKEGINKDFEVVGSDEFVNYTHRSMADGSEIYFISNDDSTATDLKYRFRVKGKVPELWDAMDGSTRDALRYKIGEATTEVDIQLEPSQSIFVVFRRDAEVVESNKAIEVVETSSIDLSENWDVTFEKEYGYDATVAFPKLLDWSTSQNDEVKYYSGTATYNRDVTLSQEQLDAASVAPLNLGDVQISAEIFVNGERVGLDWIAPFEMDVYPYLKAGENSIEIKVTNQWTNRLIGDERYPKQDGGYKYGNSSLDHVMPEWYRNNEPMPEGPRITFCTGQFYNAKSELIPAGLVGPVVLSLQRESVVER